MDTIHRQLTEYYELYKETDLLYGHVAEQSGLSAAMFWTIYMVYASPNGCAPKDVCGFCAMSKQTVHSALKKLEREGYVRLETDERDRRSKRIVLLEKGEHYAAAYLRPLFRAEEEAFAAMSEGEREGLLRGSRVFLEQLRCAMARYSAALPNGSQTKSRQTEAL